MKKLVFRPERCTGCRACELACSFFCDGVFSPTRSRIRVVRIDEEGIDVPIGCAHCDNAPCMLVCPSPLAMYRDKDTGAVVINVDACIGCRSCMLICPFGAINHDAEKGFCYKCDLCHGDPECVKWCFTKAIEYVEDEEIRRSKRSRVAEEVAKVSLEAARFIKPGKG
ncbi:MAG: 4Fe-4S dicluster domain-containing protein [Thermoprotei archaeon]|nr:MAG: 4Fe-4S dicluster domain-containing protein [Thermoprotei archaeon]RLF13816.1 MAG: 4Fe-4S dicluster domain-containing protein [Thermoprotei archaeon]